MFLRQNRPKIQKKFKKQGRPKKDAALSEENFLFEIALRLFRSFGRGAGLLPYYKDGKAFGEIIEQEKEKARKTLKEQGLIQ